MNSQFITDKDFEDYKALQQRLMSLPESEQLNEINAVLEQNSVIGLKLANAVLKNKKYFDLLLEQGLEKANASEIELWLKYLLPRIGFRRVIAILSNKLSEQPHQVAKASYWLPKFLPKDNERSALLLKNLLKKEQKVLGSTFPIVREVAESPFLHE